MEEELKKINDDFHKAIAEKKHCYERDEKADLSCDCEYFYKKWIETKEKYRKKTIDP